MKQTLAVVLWMTTAAFDVAAQEAPVMLRVKPVLCITDKRDQDCETTFLVQWSSRRSGHYCLEDDFSTVPLHCWEQQSSGRFSEDRVVIRSFSYWLTAPGSEQPLAEAKVELMTLYSPDRRRNRRNRHAWSIL